MLVSTIVRSAGTCPNAMRLALSKSKLRKPQASLLYVASSYNGQSYDFPDSRCFSTTKFRLQEGSSPSTSKDAATATPVSSEDVDTEEYRERFIPITRQSIIRYLMEENQVLMDNEKKVFPEFARALDCALVNQYKGVLGELKTLFDPINPDKETLQTREFSRREKLDNEFWLLQRLHEVMKRANFQELSKPTVEKHLCEHTSTVGVRVSVDSKRYDVLRFWVLGQEMPKVSLSVMERLTNAIFRRPPRDAEEYYKRVVVATRLKKDSKLILKAFKEIPIQDLEMLLPDGTIMMSKLDKGILGTSITVAAFGILAKVVTYLASLHVEWTLMLASVTGLVGFRAWSLYRTKRNEYLIKLSQMLYYKTVANNVSLLAVLVDRAEDECLKEALLTYTFLLNSRPVDQRQKPYNLMSTIHVGGVPREELCTQVEDWIEKRAGVRIQFDTSEALPILKSLGLVTEKDGKLNAVLLDLGRTMLPDVPMSASSMGVHGSGLMDGFDRNVYLETEEEYKLNDKKMKKYGWF